MMSRWLMIWLNHRGRVQPFGSRVRQLCRQRRPPGRVRPQRGRLYELSELA